MSYSLHYKEPTEASKHTDKENQGMTREGWTIAGGVVNRASQTYTVLFSVLFW
jgi:hypothetical protein